MTQSSATAAKELSSSQSVASAGKQLKEFNAYQAFADDAEKGFDSFHFADAEIIAGEGDDRKSFRVCSPLLAFRCEYFQKCFFGDHNETRAKVLTKPNIKSETMETVIRFLYSGKVQITEQSAVPLVAASDELGITHLYKLAFKHVFTCLTNESAVSVLNAAVEYHCLELAQKAREFILENPDAAFKNPEFGQIDENSMVEMFSSDGLKMFEESVWAHIIRWGRLQCGLTSTKRKEMTDSQFAMLAERLKKLAPLFRVFLTNSEFVINEVEPYQVVSADVVLEAYRFHLKPQSVNADHPWIQPRKVTPTLNRFCSPLNLARIKKAVGKEYTLSLIHLGSKHGFAALDFHRNCDGRGPTITFVSVSNGGKPPLIAAGYSAVSWTSKEEFVHNPSCKLFAINPPNGQGFTEFANSGAASIFCHAQRGPTFGCPGDKTTGPSYDLAIASDCNSKADSSSALGAAYSGKSAAPTLFFGVERFKVEDYAVYLLS